MSLENYKIKTNNTVTGVAELLKSAAAPANILREKWDALVKSSVQSGFNALIDGVTALMARKIVGEIKPFAGSTAPTGTLLCDGAAVSRTQYADLFAVIGTVWGEGNGSTTFNLPSLGGRTLIGKDGTYTLGVTGGAATHTLGITEIPSHTHDDASFTYPTSGSRPGEWRYLLNERGYEGFRAGGAVGGGRAHNNMQPYAVVNYVIVY